MIYIYSQFSNPILINRKKIKMNRITRRMVSDLRLKAIGKPGSQVKKSAFNKGRRVAARIVQTNSYCSSEQASFLSEETQESNYKGSESQNIICNRAFLDMRLENPDVSRFASYKMSILQKQLLNLTIFIFLLAAFQSQYANSSDDESKKNIQNHLLIMISISHIFLIILIILRKLLVIQMQMSQRRVYFQPLRQKSIFSNRVHVLCKNKQLCIQLAIQLLIVVVHPTIFTKNITYQSFSSGYKLFIIYKLNDLLNLLISLKIYIIFRSIFNLTIFSTPRAVRVCYNKKVQNDYIFMLKCVYKTHQVYFPIIMVLITVVIFSFGFKMTEGTVSKLNLVDQNGFESYENCFYFAFITIGSVGYGEYAIRTQLARVLASMLACFGVLYSSLIVVSIYKNLEMTSFQMRSHSFLYRLSHRKKLQLMAKQSISLTLQMVRHLLQAKQKARTDSNGITNTEDRMQGRDEDPEVKKQQSYLHIMFKQLKKKLQTTKNQQMMTKNIVLQADIGEVMLYSFYTIQQEYKEISSGQRNLKKLLEKAEKDPLIKQRFLTSFKKEVANIITRYNRKNHRKISISKYKL